MTGRFNRRFKIIMESCAECEDLEAVISHDPKSQTIQICAYCDPKGVERDKWENMGYAVSHGICDECLAKQEEILKSLGKF